MWWDGAWVNSGRSIGWFGIVGGLIGQRMGMCEFWEEKTLFWLKTIAGSQCHSIPGLIPNINIIIYQGSKSSSTMSLLKKSRGPKSKNNSQSHYNKINLIKFILNSLIIWTGAILMARTISAGPKASNPSNIVEVHGPWLSLAQLQTESISRDKINSPILLFPHKLFSIALTRVVAKKETR